MSALARWCFRRRFIVIGLWVAALIVLGGLSRAAGDQYNDSFSLPGTESTKALQLLQSSFSAQAGDSDTIVWHVAKGNVHDAAVRGRVQPMLAKVARSSHVAGVQSPYAPRGQAQISRDGRTAYATVNFDKLAQDLPKRAYTRVIDLAHAAAAPGLQVELGGNGIEQATQKPPGGTEGLGILCAAVVLFIAFGSLLAMLLPLLTAVLALGASLSAAGLLAGAINIATFAPTLAALIGLGVGVDYALFIVTRHRNQIKAGRTPEEAIVTALDTSGRAVLFAGGTVCVALLGLLVLGVSFLNGVAVAAAMTVVFTMLAAVTLLPALLAVIGVRVLSRRERRRLAEGPADPDARTAWARWADYVEAHSGRLAIAATVVMLVLAIPFLSLRLGSSDAGSDPSGTTTRKAYDLLAQGFGPGFNGPLQLVARTPRGKADTPTLTRLAAATRATPGVVSVSPPAPNPKGTVAIIQVIPKGAPQDRSTSELITHLRDDVVPSATRGSGVRVYVGGVTAIFDDFAGVLGGKLPLFIGVIVLLGCLLLLIAFRSLLIPLTAAVMNLLAAGGAFGVVTAVFQWGWGAEALGAGRAGPVEAFLPVIMLAILFGLSMDYQVFLVSRMHEEWSHTHDNRRAVLVGQAETGRVITAAATIMILVFASFVLGGQRVIAEFGIGLASAVALDAFILRTVLVPAIMHRLGDANWWLPGWLDRALPHVSVDPSDTAVAERV
jgi:RND superfamily putative drug exporter